MTDGQWLFAVFATLYFLECLRWLPAQAYVLTGTGSYWRVRRPLAQLELAGGSPLLLPILPPPTLHLVTLPWLLVPALEGLEVGAEDADIRLLPWDSLAPAAEGPKLHLGAGLAVRLGDARLAKEWEKRLTAWRGMSEQAREKDFLKFARRSLEAKNATPTAARLTAQTRMLRWQGGVVFLWTFGVVTGVYRWFGDGLEVLAAGGALFLMLWLQAIVFWRVARRVEPRLPHRFWKTLAMAFLPQQAMRAADQICRAQPFLCHPLAAHELLDAETWRSLAVRFWNQARHGHAKSAELQRRALEAFFSQRGIAPSELEEVPKREEGSAAFCPRCLAQFRQADGVCQDCGGVALKEWPAA